MIKTRGIILGVIFMPKRDKALKGARPVTLMTMDETKITG